MKSLNSPFSKCFFLLGIILFLLGGCDSSPDASTTNNSTRNAKAKGPLFSKLSPGQTGISFDNKVKDTENLNGLNWSYLYLGGGVSVGDINNDGLQDLFFSGNMVADKLYLNKGNMQFEDVTEKAGIVNNFIWSFGSTMADVNNDGWMDIYLCKSGWSLNPGDRKNLLYINQGDGTFREMGAAAGLDDDGYSFQATFFDMDRDNDLDMYLINQPNALRSERRKYRTGEEPYINSLTSDRLYENNGNGTFTDVSDKAGIKNFAYGLNVVASDLNDDGWTDLYVSNDYEKADYIYINNKNGTFTDKMKDKLRHISNFAMGSDVADYNNDGNPDIAVVDMQAADHYRSKTNMGSMRPELFWKFVEDGHHYQYMVNTLQLNNGNGTFSEVGHMAGMSRTDWSWGILFADFDNDQHKDLVVTNGILKDIRNNDFLESLRSRAKAEGGTAQFNLQELLNSMPSNPIPNYIYRNTGKLTFEDKTKDWGFHDPGFSQGIAYADLDNDGDLDLVLNNINAPASIYKNSADRTGTNNWFRLKLSGPRGNTHALNSKITITANGSAQYQELTLTRGYESSVEPIVHFGMGDASKVDILKITWPDGKETVLRGLDVNQVLEVKHASGKKAGNPPTKPQPIFANVKGNAGLNFTHKENEFNDFEKEILLPHKQSENGPFLSSADVNGDQLADLFVGGASGQSGVLFLQKPDGSFAKAPSQPWSADSKAEDLGSLFFDADGDKDQDLYVVSGGNEFAIESADLQDRLYLNDGKGGFQKASNALPALKESGQKVVCADFDKDGDLDLFTGGRVVPGKYPYAPKSYLLRNDNGKFTDVTAELAPDLTNPGMVTDAEFDDFDGDGDADLMISGEWLGIRYFQNENGRFTDATESAGLADATGWWFSLEAGDIDKDGDLDLIGGNLGLNAKFSASKKKPFIVYGNDFDKNGTTDIVLAKPTEDGQVPVRGRECSSEQMPFITEKYPSYHDFASADLEDIYTPEALAEAVSYEAKEFRSCFIRNDGNGRFTLVPLPEIAQISPVMDIHISDFNQDGNPDVILAGNHYGAEVETVRYDAGNGLVLLGDGTGQLKPMTINESGFFAPGNVKSLLPISTPNGQLLVIGNNDSGLGVFMWKGNEQLLGMK